MVKKKKASWNGFSLKPRREMPEGLWLSCPSCRNMLFRKTVDENLSVCPECQYHFRIDGVTRLRQLADEGSFEEIGSDLASSDPLQFTWGDKSYKDRIQIDPAQMSAHEAMLAGKAFIRGRGVMLAVMNFSFLGGSMGMVVGEKFCMAVDRAIEESLPLVVVCCSGGARMHEGLVALQQMAKTSAALARYDQAGGLYISVLTDPTTGGVAASFALLGDIIIAEPKALIGFAGPRVIQQTIKVELPEGFQTSEFLLEHGFIDMIVHRKNLRSEIGRLIDYCGK
ncbi:MAG TPA: acetyl-CoA carboxylase, carboxyltransferase subunit beta [Anaerohalosphaeraceae bacterium]|nr:acetyl-CoA carboxylase, carboxyltransferase subunit beta [Anaerohalosphaeraceae bacterium]HOL32540.1 acetyl-CoA carboxylase, carboxyltransferase subunit beta [Anaerohalosphaeraceae bacterium]HOM75534.1 acetyl-CoA carboxylase, carboxyltransferase subunit beta [Anaerohalosphaeraceae bacterium]HPC64739.1 acetyl-CoA carboxylase, carboxyltransferase subunit beta [Anaerohalosphaeraceae bacterium]HPO70645.1 acetyl-CoA carboxylase, carboxyltransferase subunit beta [Anaerohalosphaeraceae bacterium]